MNESRGFWFWLIDWLVWWVARGGGRVSGVKSFGVRGLA